MAMMAVMHMVVVVGVVPANRDLQAQAGWSRASWAEYRKGRDLHVMAMVIVMHMVAVQTCHVCSPSAAARAEGNGSCSAHWRTMELTLQRPNAKWNAVKSIGYGAAARNVQRPAK